MAFPRLDVTVRNLQRYRQIINVLLGYGFGHVVERLDLGPYGDVSRRLLRRPPGTPLEHLGFAVRLRMAFEELGPTFVKLGQMLALQGGALPEELLAEFAKLHDAAAPVPGDRIRAIVESSLDCPLDGIFAHFDLEPLAAASIAQAHRATLLDGADVVVKVRRPGIVPIVRTDMDILMDLARLATRHLPELRRFDPEGLVEQLSQSMLRELDFRYEARNLEIFARNMKDQPGIAVPGLYRDLVRADLLALDFVDGIKISELDALEAAGHDLRALAANGTEAILTQVFRDGFFHADPHPGNLFVLADGQIAPIDYGLMGRLDRLLLQELAYFMMALVRRDLDGIVEFYLRTGSFPDDTVPPRFRTDVSEFLDQYHGVALGQLDVQALTNDLFELLSRNDVHPPPQLMLLVKTLMMQEAIGRRLDPELDLLESARPYIARLLARRFAPDRLWSIASDAAIGYMDLARTLPRELQAFSGRLRNGKQAFIMKHDGLDDFRHEMERSSNRLTFGMVIGALVMASAVLMSVGPGPTISGIPVFGLGGFALSAMAGIWLIIGILRSGRL